MPSYQDKESAPTEALHDPYYLLIEKCNKLRELIGHHITLLNEGGYKGRRDTLLKILNHYRKAFRDFAMLTLDLDRPAEMNTPIRIFLTYVHTLTEMLLKQLRTGNCDPQSTTQPLRLLLCQLLSPPRELQHPILTEVTAKEIDEALKQRLHSFSDKDKWGVEFLTTLFANESRLIVIPPKEASLLPTNFFHGDDFFRLSAHCIAWWRLNHHFVSTLQPGSFFDRARAPGGLTALMTQLIGVVNQTTDDTIEILNSLRSFIQTLPESAISKDTHSTRVIRALKENLHDYTWCVDPDADFSPITVGSLRELIEHDYRLEIELGDILRSHDQDEELLNLCDVLTLLVHFKRRWESLNKTDRKIYLTEDNSLSELNRHYIAIATAVARQLSFSDQFKMPLGLLMPGSAYDQLISVQYRRYVVCDQLARMLSLDEEDDHSIDVLSEIAPASLLVVNGLPISSHWYHVSAGAESLCIPNGEAFTLLHPISSQSLKKHECEQLLHYGDAGMQVYLKTVIPDPTKRSLLALVRFLHAMVLNGGSAFYYIQSDDVRLHVAYSDFLKTIESFTQHEQLRFWSTPIPGLATHATIKSTLERSFVRDESTCTHVIGKVLALVIHQYFENADELLPKDTRRANLAMSDTFKEEFRYIDQNRKKPAPDDKYAEDAIMPETDRLTLPMP